MRRMQLMLQTSAEFYKVLSFEHAISEFLCHPSNASWRLHLCKPWRPHLCNYNTNSSSGFSSMITDRLLQRETLHVIDVPPFLLMFPRVLDVTDSFSICWHLQSNCFETMLSHSINQSIIHSAAATIHCRFNFSNSWILNIPWSIMYCAFGHRNKKHENTWRAKPSVLLKSSRFVSLNLPLTVWPSHCELTGQGSDVYLPLTAIKFSTARKYYSNR